VATIELERLTKYYGSVRGIEEVTLTVDSGEVLGFIGPNGAGKSTMIRTALGLLKPTSGHARILGIGPDDPARLFQRVGYLPSDVRGYDGVTVGQFLQITAGFYPRPVADRTDELIRLFEIETTRRFAQLSTGNRKKVGIAIAFLHSPDVVILDEPTDGLDPLMRARFYELIDRERKRGTTILFSSHTLSEVQANCSRIIFIRDGRIVETGPFVDLQRRSVRRLTAYTTIPAVAEIEAVVARTVGMTIESDGAETQISILMEGETGAMLARLPLAKLRDIRVVEPSLEELFLHYYRSESESPHG
jgi:ABC-2 type transport system ATP-binding protein